MRLPLAGRWVLPALLGGMLCGSAALAQGTISNIARPSTTVRELMQSKQGRARADTYYLLALAAARKGKTAEALRNIETGFRIEPANTKLMNLRAALWARQGRVRDALREFRRVLQLEPDNSYARTAIQLMQRSVQQPAVVVRDRPAPAAAPVAPTAPVKEDAATPAPPKKLLQSTYFDQAKQKQGCYYQLSAILRAQTALGESDASLKETFDPKVLIEKKLLPATPICPSGGAYTWKEGAPICSVHGSLKDVEAEVKTVFVDFNRGMRAKLGRNLPEAIKAFEQVVVLYPNWSEAHYQLADSYFRNNQTTEAAKTARDCLRLAPNNLDAKLLLAHVYFKSGQKDAALGLLDDITKGAVGSVYGLASRSLASAIRSGRSYLDLFPPEK